MQDTYMTAMQKLDTLGDGGKFPKWINIIAVNRCKKSFARHAEESLEEISEQGFEAPEMTRYRRNMSRTLQSAR